jgi:hypothetical protein
MNNWKINLSRERGQSLVEFALSLTILLILVVGIFDVARALFTYLSMRDAAQEGALFGSIEPFNTTGIVERACTASNMLSVLDCGTNATCSGGACDVRIDVTLSGDPCMETGGGTQNDITVDVSYDHFPLTMPLIGQIVGADGQYSIPIRATIIDTIIQPDCP